MKGLNIYPFFNMLESQEKERFSSFLRPVSLSKGSIIHYQGDICTHILLLLDGEIRLYTQADDFSEEVTLYTLKGGEQCLANTASVLGSSSTIGTAVCETDIEAYLLSERDAKTFMKESHVYQQYIMTLYSTKIVDLTLALQRVKFQNLDERIMQYLSNNGKRTVNITHNDLAKEMNTSRSVVSRVLKKLEQKRKISLHRSYIELTNDDR